MTLSLSQIFPRKKTKLSLVPLIDVVFILLLFFLLSTQLNVLHNVNVEFPISVETDELPDVHVVFLESNDGAFTFRDVSYRPNDLSVLSSVDSHREDVFVVESSRRVNVQGLIGFVDSMHRAGISNISLFDE